VVDLSKDRSPFHRSLPWLIVGLVIGTFLLDLYTPRGVATWALYFPAIVAALFWKGRRAMLMVTACVTLLALVDFWLSTPGSTTTAIINRSVFVASAMLLAGLCSWIGGCRSALFEAHTAVELAMEGISRLNEQGRYLSVNTQYAALLGYRPEELIGQPWQITVHPDDYPVVQTAFKQMLETGRGEAEIRGLRKDGSLIHKQVVIVKPDPTTMSGHYCFMRDITERKRAEAIQAAERQALELVAQGARLEEVLEFICRTIEAHTAPMLCSVMLVTKDGAHLTCAAAPSLPDDYNRAVNGIVIGPTAGSCGSAAYFGIPSLVADIAADPLWKDYAQVALAHGLRACWSQPILNSTGAVLGTFAAYYREPRTPQTSDRNLVERAGQLAALAIQHSRMSDALRESEARFQAFMDHSPTVAFIKDEGGRHLYVNSMFERVFHRSLADLADKTEGEWLPEAVAARLRENDRLVFSAGQPLEFEETVPTPDGRLRHWLVLKFPLSLTTERRWLGGMAIDITERKRAEEALRQAHRELERRVLDRTAQLEAANSSLQAEIAERKRAERRLRLTQFTVDRAANGTFWISPTAEILYANATACEALGYSQEELLGKTVYDIDPNFTPAVWPSHWDDLKRRGSFTFDSIRRTKDGELRHTEVTVNYLEYDGQEYNCAIVRDITQRKKAEEALRESEARYRLLTDATFDGIAIHEQGVLLEVNAGLERMFGYAPGELIGRPILDLVAEESRAMVVENMRLGACGPYEAMGRRKDGTVFYGEIVIRPHRYRGRDVRLVAGRDITERKRLEAQLARYTEELERQVAERTAEIAKLEAQRAQTEKLAAVGQLAAGVAHEINNPIAGIKNAFMLVKQAVDSGHPYFEFVAMIEREIARVAAIIQNMYQLYRREPRRKEAVDLAALIRDIEGLFSKRVAQRGLVLVTDLEPSVSRLYVPQGDLLQVLLNLLQNAVDCSKEGGAITVTIRQDAQAIRIAVADQGPGIAPDVLPHIFDPFFTTKNDGEHKGMGLGLSVSHSLVQAMGGRIEVQTALNEGSTFSIVLPLDAAIPPSCGTVAMGEEELIHDR